MITVACYSIKGGVGKTALAVNLAYEVSRRGHRTLLVDLDPQAAAGFYFRVRADGNVNPRRLLKDGDRLRRAIRASDYENLDVLPSALSFREFDVVLDRLKKSTGRLARMLHELRHDYAVTVIDPPPNITLLSENVLAAATALVVPVVPTTLSERTLEQLVAFATAEEIPVSRMIPFFTMVENRKRLHRETMASLRARYPTFLQATVPYCTDVERMGLQAAPIVAKHPNSRGGKAYRRLCAELMDTLGIA